LQYDELTPEVAERGGEKFECESLACFSKVAPNGNKRTRPASLFHSPARREKQQSKEWRMLWKIIIFLITKRRERMERGHEHVWRVT
jgi:hypothetical protein